MWFVFIGVVVLVLKHFAIGPIGRLGWADDGWLLLSPWALAVAWWAWADRSGWTRRQAMKKADAVKEQRRLRQVESLGLNAKRGRP